MNDFFLGTAIGGLVAFVCSVPAIAVELRLRRNAANAPIVGVKTLWGRKLEKHEVFLVALLLHVVIGSLFGLAYVLFVKRGWLVFTNDPYSLLSLVIFAVGSWIVAGVLLFPALGLGLFGRREGSHVWMEMLVSHLIIGAGMWGAVQYYQPFFFSS